MWLPIRNWFTGKSRFLVLFLSQYYGFNGFNYLLCQGRGWSSALGMTLPFSSHPSTSYTQFYPWGRWVDKLLARAPALWVRIQTSLKNPTWTTEAKEWQHYPPKKKKKLRRSHPFLLNHVFLCSVFCMLHCVRFFGTYCVLLTMQLAEQDIVQHLRNKPCRFLHVTYLGVTFYTHSSNQIHSPWLEYIVDSGIGLSYRPLSYRPASLCSLAGRTTLCHIVDFISPVRGYEFGYWTRLFKQFPLHEILV